MATSIDKWLIASVLTLIFGVSSAAYTVKNNLKAIVEFRNHQVLPLETRLNREKERQLEQHLKVYLKKRRIGSVEGAIAYSLDFVADSLSFKWGYFLGETGRDHYNFPTSVKPADCRDYAFLFHKTFDYVVARVGLTGIKSEVMRSNDVLLLGARVDNTDWVRIRDKSSGRTWLINPVFYDYGLPYNLEEIVK